MHEELAQQLPLYRSVATALGEDSDVERVFRVIEIVASLRSLVSESRDLTLFLGSEAPQPTVDKARSAINAIQKYLRHRLWLPFGQSSLVDYIAA
jgi:hypothetical protein